MKDKIQQIIEQSVAGCHNCSKPARKSVSYREGVNIIFKDLCEECLDIEKPADKCICVCHDDPLKKGANYEHLFLFKDIREQFATQLIEALEKEIDIPEEISAMKDMTLLEADGWNEALFKAQQIIKELK